MGSTQTFVDFVVEQIDYPGEISARKMFGEYGVYADHKLFGLICDNKLFLKPTNSGVNLLGRWWKHHPTRELNLHI